MMAQKIILVKVLLIAWHSVIVLTRTVTSDARLLSKSKTPLPSLQ